MSMKNLQYENLQYIYKLDIIILTLVSKELSISKKLHAVNVILKNCNVNKKSLISF